MGDLRDTELASIPFLKLLFLLVNKHFLTLKPLHSQCQTRKVSMKPLTYCERAIRQISRF